MLIQTGTDVLSGIASIPGLLTTIRETEEKLTRRSNDINEHALELQALSSVFEAEKSVRREEIISLVKKLQKYVPDVSFSLTGLARVWIEEEEVSSPEQQRQQQHRWTDEFKEEWEKSVERVARYTGPPVTIGWYTIDKHDNQSGSDADWNPKPSNLPWHSAPTESDSTGRDQHGWK